ncbi:DUF4913 domain-containing protein [Streptomyces sp. B6B3]|uniref:DUF4913 domain-containing protein n=1 Tax=Streptomyces sp. B6B3 TaxID=3153570 RepID=UPI00325F53EB
MSDAAQSSREPCRVPDDDLDDLACTLAKVTNQVQQHGAILDRLTAETTATPAHQGGNDAAKGRGDESTPVSILAMDNEDYTAELAALSAWVQHLLLPVYGKEISTTRPWCDRWQEHPEAVSRLHALWLAWQQLTDAEAGLSGPSVWHRDHLDHALAQLRAPDGPFAACTTSASRPQHRLLPTPSAQPKNPSSTRR